MNETTQMTYSEYKKRGLLDIPIQDVLDDIPRLRAEGTLEISLVGSYLGCPDCAKLDQERLLRAFKACDPIKLRHCGRTDLPGDLGCLTVFRGASQLTGSRKFVGLSWTISLPTACWFAARYKRDKPTVYVAQLILLEVRCWIPSPTEEEVIAWPKRFYPLVMSKREMEELAKEHARDAG